MKRLKLEVFKAKNLKKANIEQVNELLGQVLGTGRDGHIKDKYDKADDGVGSEVVFKG